MRYLLIGFIYVTLLLCASCSKIADEADPKSLLDKPKLSEQETLEKATDAEERELFSLAREYWQDLINGYPGSYYAVLAELRIADSYFKTTNFSEALAAYEAFLKEHPAHESAPYAYFQIANCYFEQYRGEAKDQTPLQKAIQKYRVVIEKFPQSTYRQQAEAKIKESHESLATHELVVAKFYLNQEKFDSSLNRYRELFTKYPNTEAARDGLHGLQTRADDSEIAGEMLAALKTIDLKKINAPLSPKIVGAYISSSGISSTKDSSENILAKNESVIAAAAQKQIHEGISEGIESIIKNVSCKSNNGFVVFSALLEKPVAIEKASLPNKVLVKIPSLSSAQQAKEICNHKGLSAKVSVENKKEVISLELENLREVKTFLIDKPSRVVSIFQ